MPDDSYQPDDTELDDPELEDELEEGGEVLDASDTLEGDPGDDPLDTGYEPPDRWSAGERYGTTLAEERAGESLDQLLAEEVPDVDPYAEAEEEELSEDGPLGVDEPEPRAGRLVAEDEGVRPDTEADLVANDVGIDSGAASAEEAAVRVETETDNPGL
jgi:hypothetical protein